MGVYLGQTWPFCFPDDSIAFCDGIYIQPESVGRQSIIPSVIYTDTAINNTSNKRTEWGGGNVVTSEGLFGSRCNIISAMLNPNLTCSSCVCVLCTGGGRYVTSVSRGRKLLTPHLI